MTQTVMWQNHKVKVKKKYFPYTLYLSDQTKKYEYIF